MTKTIAKDEPKTAIEKRAHEKIRQLKAEFEKSRLCWHSIAHLARDLSAAANARNVMK